MSNYLVTGASRGIGLGLIELLESLPKSTVNHIFAATRAASANAELASLTARSPERVHHITLDAASDQSIKSAAGAVSMILSPESGGLDVLINNAAIAEGLLDHMSDVDNAVLTVSLSTNVIGPHNVIRQFLPLLRAGKERKILNIASTIGSFGLSQGWCPFPAYRISKAALNMLTVGWADDLREEGFIVISLSPGRVATDLAGREDCDLTPAQSARGILKSASGYTKADNGKFVNIIVDDWPRGKQGIGGKYDGEEFPW